jgi:hypothetical protein
MNYQAKKINKNHSDSLDSLEQPRAVMNSTQQQSRPSETTYPDGGDRHVKDPIYDVPPPNRSAYQTPVPTRSHRAY